MSALNKSIVRQLGPKMPERLVIGVSLDESRNRAASNSVNDGASRGWVLVLASQEGEQIARHVRELLA